MSAYQQRQLAHLTTGSEFAACRGKRGAPEGRMCGCGLHRQETVEHAILECPLYAQQRPPVDKGMHDLIDTVKTTFDYAMSREEALRWAIDGLSPGWVLDGESTAPGLGALRRAVLGMHREVRVVRYRANRATPAGRRSGAL